MKKLFIVLLAFGSASAFSGEQCNQLASQESRAASLAAEFRYDAYNSLDGASNVKLRQSVLALLASADKNFTNAVFDTQCETSIKAVNEAVEVLEQHIGNQKAENALTEMLKLKD